MCRYLYLAHTSIYLQVCKISNVIYRYICFLLIIVIRCKDVKYFSFRTRNNPKFIHNIYLRRFPDNLNAKSFFYAQNVKNRDDYTKNKIRNGHCFVRVFVTIQRVRICVGDLIQFPAFLDISLRKTGFVLADTFPILL